MSAPMRAELKPTVKGGYLLELDCWDGHVFARLTIETPNGPPPGETYEQFTKRIGKLIADAINEKA